MDQKKISIIIEWNTVRSIKNMQYFLAFVNFYKIFIKDYSKIAAPLIQLTGKGKFTWNEKAKETFLDLK